ncbi:MAG: hypothetical protein AAGE18_08215 [Pseudomonadota bacterium]
MGFRYVDLAEAQTLDGLRMVVVSGAPSLWGEAAKGLFQVKGLDFAAVRLTYDDPALKAWAGQRNAPVVVYGQERPRAGWVDILLLAERLAPMPALLPADPALRALTLGLSHEICGEEGLGWTRRLQLIHGGLTGGAGFLAPVAQYLAKKYGYRSEAAAGYGDRTIALLTMLAERLAAQKDRGSSYFVGDGLTAVDIYSATAMAMFDPLPEADCAMDPATRAAFSTLDEATRAALDPILLDHRDRMYAEVLERPLSL